MAVTVLLIRHAAHVQLGATLSGRAAGLSLSSEGAAQAARLARQLASGRVDRLQSSPLDRAVETACALGVAAGLAAEPVEALNEIDFGEWTGRAFAELADDPLWTSWNRERSRTAAPGGESMIEAQTRIVAHLEAVTRDHDGETVAMVSHCDVIRAAVAWVLGLSLDNMLRFDVDPGSVAHIVLGDWGGRLLSLGKRTD